MPLKPKPTKKALLKAAKEQKKSEASASSASASNQTTKRRYRLVAIEPNASSPTDTSGMVMLPTKTRTQSEVPETEQDDLFSQIQTATAGTGTTDWQPLRSRFGFDFNSIGTENCKMRAKEWAAQTSALDSWKYGNIEVKDVHRIKREGGVPGNVFVEVSIGTQPKPGTTASLPGTRATEEGLRDQESDGGGSQNPSEQASG